MQLLECGGVHTKVATILSKQKMSSKFSDLYRSNHTSSKPGTVVMAVVFSYSFPTQV